MNIEKALRNYLKGNRARLKEKVFFDCSRSDGNAAFNVLFKLANEEIDTMTDQKTLDRLVQVLKLGEVTLQNNEGLDRNNIARKIYKLQQKLDRIILEGKNKFTNINKINSEFNKVRRQLEVLVEMNESKDTKQYDFMEFLVEEAKNITYLEYTFKKMPSLVNVRDKNEVPLFLNIIERYIESLQSDEEDSLYYDNLLSLIFSQKSFNIGEREKREYLDILYKRLDKLNYNKKVAKKNRKATEAINILIERIKGYDVKTTDIDEVASKYNIHVNFSPTLLESLSLVRESKEGKMTGREEVTDYVISMDKKGSIEIDDALSCRRLENGNYLLGVHIASVLAHYPYESDIVQEAIYRNQSIYLPFSYQTEDDELNKTITIFPYDFIKEKGSLLKGKKRLARSYYFEITPEGELVQERFIKSIVTNNEALTYYEANDIIENGSDNERLAETLQNLSSLSTIIEEKYKGSDLYEKFKENTDDYSELRVKKSGSENIVYQSMLLTGNRVAEFFASHNYPCLYRVHEVDEDNQRKLQAMIDTLNESYGGEQFKNLYQLIEGIYPKGWYDTSGRHMGLELEHYCHCTSLLRRAADIIVEHALEVCYDKEPTKEELEALSQEIAEKAVTINSRQSATEYFVKEYRKKYRRR